MSARQFVIVGITDGTGFVRYVEKGRLGPASYSWTTQKSRAKKFSNQSEPRRIAQEWIRPYEDKRVTVLVEEVQATVTGAKNPTRKKPRADGPYVLMSLNTDGSIIGYLSSTGSGRRAIFAHRYGAITFVSKKAADVYNEEHERGRLTPVHVADLPDPDGPNVLKITAHKNPAPKFGKRKSAPPKGSKSAPKKRVAFGKRPARAPAGAGGWIVRGIAAENTHYYFTGHGFDTDRRKAAIYADRKALDGILAYVEDRAPRQILAVDSVRA